MIPSIKRILIAADLSEMDDKLLSFVRQLSDQIKIEKLYLIHIIPNMLVPDNTDLAFHKMFSTGYPIDEKVKDLLSGKASHHFEGTGVDIALEVVEGKAYEKLLEMITLKEIDLLVVGNKTHSEGSGITAKRIARKANCNVLFVTENTPKTTDKILVPIDFSKNSVRALNTAFQLKGEHTKITALNIIQMLHTDYYFGLASNTDYRESMKKNAINAFEDFQQEYVSEKDKDILQTEVIINEAGSTASQLKDYINHHDIDIVIMGAKGHTPIENFLMGSVTESFVSAYSKTPVLIIR